MKKIAVLALAVALAAGTIGCGAPAPTGGATPATKK
jgi:hypothetical protein